MDGSSVLAAEQRSFRSVTATARRAIEIAAETAAEAQPAPVVAAPTLELIDEPVNLETPAVPGWMFDEPVEATAAPMQPDLIDADLYEAAVDPMPGAVHAAIEDESLADEPLFPSIHADERRPQKGGWLSLFGGRPRNQTLAEAPVARERPAAAPVAQVRTVSGAQLAEEPKGEEGEDLNIPSFLRRLAN